MIDNFELNNKQLSKLLTLDKSAQDTLQIFLNQFDRTLKGKLDRSNMTEAEKQKVKRGIVDLKKNDIIKAIPSKKGNFILNPNYFGSIFSYTVKQEWDSSNLTRTSIFGNQVIMKPIQNNSTKNIPKELPTLITHESLRKAIDKCKNKSSVKLTLDEMKEIQKIKLDQRIEEMKLKFQSKSIFPNLNDGLEYIHLIIEEFKLTVLQHAEGLIIPGQYDESLPRYKFSTIVTAFENDSEKLSETRAIKKNNRNKKMTFSKKDRSILYKLHFIQNINHNSSCVEEMKANNNIPNCTCYSNAIDELNKCLFDDKWFIDERNQPFQEYAKEWFYDNYPEICV